MAETKSTESTTDKHAADKHAADKPAAAKTDGKTETRSFQAEVSRLLDIVANSLYSEREVFVRELVSNAADACDRLRYAALTEPGLVEGDGEFRIELACDEAVRTLSLADNGIGMSHDELIENLGTIARSGTSAFVEQLSADAKGAKSGDRPSLIGQFGVGFYAAFMAAERVDVVSRRAGSSEAWRWESDGRGSFTISPAERPARGTTVTVHLKEDAAEFAQPERLRAIVRTYSDHIAFPILLSQTGSTDTDGAGKVGTGKGETINQASALWTRPKAEIEPQQYKEFYHHVGHSADDPWLTLHYHAEGVIEYTALLFIPTMQPFDLFDQDRRTQVKLYVRRVFITDDCDGLVPRWLRFLRGVVDSEDLQLNVSREMLQNNAVVSKIRTGLTKRVLSELAKHAESDPAGYAAFWDNFGAVLKEGLYESFADREQLLKLVRFRSTRGDGTVGLADYVGRMKEGQKAVYYISGGDAAALRNSPQLEGYLARGLEVLLLTDPVDEFWIPAVGTFDGKPFQSVTRGGADLADIPTEAEESEEEKADAPAKADIDRLVAALKLALGNAVKDVRTSARLTDSAVCLVADENDIDNNLARLLKAHRRLDEVTPRILEINPRHALIGHLAARAATAAGPDGATGGSEIEDAAFLLLDQARIVEGEALPDPTAFARRLSAVMAKGFAA